MFSLFLISGIVSSLRYTLLNTGYLESIDTYLYKLLYNKGFYLCVWFSNFCKPEFDP